MMTKKWIFNTVNIFFVYGMHKHAFKINSSLLGMAGSVDVHQYGSLSLFVFMLFTYCHSF